MSVMTFMAQQLDARPVTPTGSGCKVDLLRRSLRDNGPQGARALASQIGVSNTGRVGALLKHEIKAGRVRFAGGLYSWQPTTSGGTPGAAEGA